MQELLREYEMRILCIEYLLMNKQNKELKKNTLKLHSIVTNKKLIEEIEIYQLLSTDRLANIQKDLRDTVNHIFRNSTKDQDDESIHRKLTTIIFSLLSKMFIYIYTATNLNLLNTIIIISCVAISCAAKSYYKLVVNDTSIKYHNLISLVIEVIGWISADQISRIIYTTLFMYMKQIGFYSSKYNSRLFVYTSIIIGICSYLIFQFDAI